MCLRHRKHRQVRLLLKRGCEAVFGDILPYFCFDLRNRRDQFCSSQETQIFNNRHQW